MNKYTNAAVPLSPIVFRVPYLFYIVSCIPVCLSEIPGTFSSFHQQSFDDSSANFGYLDCVCTMHGCCKYIIAILAHTSRYNSCSGWILNSSTNLHRFAPGLSISRYSQLHNLRRIQPIYFPNQRMSTSTGSTSNINQHDTQTVDDTTAPSTGMIPIVVIGSANYDITCYTSKIPQPGETVLASNEQQIDLSCGGKGANQAKAAAAICVSSSRTKESKQQQPQVTMICRVADDIFGTEILQQFQQYGIQYDVAATMIQTNGDKTQDDSGQKNDKMLHTGVASIVVDTNTGENQIIVTPGANYALQPNAVHEAIMTQAAQSNTIIVLLQLEIPYTAVYEAISTAATLAQGSFVLLNPAPVPNDPAVLEKLKKDYLPHIDVLIPNETELRQLCMNDMDDVDNDGEEQLAIYLLKTYNIRRAVIVTLGSRGALIVERSSPKRKLTPNEDDDENDDRTIASKSTYVETPTEILHLVKDQSVVDTVGAGDAFCGALTAYLSVTLETQPQQLCSDKLALLVRMACGYATLSVYRRGTDYPKHQDIPQYLQIDTLVPSPPEQNEVQPKENVSTPPKNVLTFVTGNAKKLEEVRQILGKGILDFPYTITNKKIDLPELQGNDVYEIAKEKCRIASKVINGPCFIEDTSLCFNALNGLPGPYIKWFLEKCGHLGLNQMLVGFDDKTAYAQTIVAYTDGSTTDNDDEAEIYVFDGRTDGTIVLPRGNLDFGWDPIFEPKESNGLTYAEMEKSHKNEISHRGRSFTKFQLFLMERQSLTQHK